MLLREMWSPLGGPKADHSEVDWLDDLKFFIDDNEDLVSQFMMPAIHRHAEFKDNPSAFKLYVKPISKCAEMYCKKFDLSKDEIFPESKLIELAQQVCEQQKQFIDKKDYETD